MDSALSKSDLNAILDIIHTALACRDNRDYRRLVAATKALLPFDHIRSLYGDCNEYKRKKMGAFQMITRFPTEWENRYSDRDYYLTDNVAYTAFRKPGLICWSDHTELAQMSETRNKKSRKIMNEAASLGLKHGWLYSFQGRRSSEFAVLSLAGEQWEKDERSRTILEHLSPHLCLAIKRVLLNKGKAPTRLTSRECEVLSWTAAGKTAWETSEILNISSRTVEYHMGKIMNKLDAVNSQQAIAIAFSSGVINY